jgi:hypothetical protein
MSDAVKFVEQLVQETSPADDFPRIPFKYGGTFKEYVNREDKYEDLSFEEWLREDKQKGGQVGARMTRIRKRVKKLFPNKKLDFEKYPTYGMSKKDPDYDKARYDPEARKQRTARDRKDPEFLKKRRARAKEYYSREKENILAKLRKKYEVSDEYRKQVAAQNKKKIAKIVNERGLFPPGQKPQDNVWHDLYRSSQAAGGGNRFVLDKKFIDNVPRKTDGTPRWAKDNYYRTIKFKDTKTGKTINYGGVKKYLNETFGKGTYEKALDGYKLKTNLRDTRIKIRGKEQKLGTALRDAVRAQGNPNVFSALEVHHPFGIKENWWSNEVVFRDANRNLNLINNRLSRAAKNIKNDADRQKLLNKFGKEVDKLPGGISLFFEGQQVGTRVPTSESVLRGVAQTVKDPALTRAINKRLASGPTLGMNLGFFPALKTAGEVIGSPAAALAFATMTVKDNLERGESLPTAVADKMVGAELLAPGAISRFAPGVMKGVLGLGRVARLFTPVGLGLTAAGVAKDVYREYKRREALGDEERLKEDLEAQEKFDEIMVGAAKGGLIPPKSGKTPHGDKGLASLADYDMTNTEFINGRY